MAGRLTQRRRVGEDGPRVVNPFSRGRGRTVPEEEAPANPVPAAAVIRGVRALSGFTGRKGRVGGPVSRSFKSGAHPRGGTGTAGLGRGRGGRNAGCSGEMRRDPAEHRWRRRSPGPRPTLRRESAGSEPD